MGAIVNINLHRLTLVRATSKFLYGVHVMSFCRDVEFQLRVIGGIDPQISGESVRIVHNRLG